jgi:hypothetical protein
MAAAVSAIAGRALEVDELAARITDARRQRIMEAAQASVDRNTATKSAPAASTAAETVRRVEVASNAAQAATPNLAESKLTRPQLSSELRAVLAQTDTGVSAGRATSARIIGQLVNALRAYEKSSVQGRA